jgi:hypothetical protein
MAKKIWASICLLLCYGVYVQSGLAQNVVTDWAGIVQPAVIKIDGQSAPRPPTSSEVLNSQARDRQFLPAGAVAGPVFTT